MAANNSGRQTTNGEEELGKGSTLAVESFKGLLKVTGFAMLAMIVGYCGGYASERGREAYTRNAGSAGH